MPYTPTPEFIAALESIDALTSDSNTPAPVAALGTATRAGLLELAAKQQLLQTMFEDEIDGQQFRAAAAPQQLESKQQAPAEDGGGVIEAAPPPLSVPPGTYEAPRAAAAAASAVPSSYEQFRGEASEQKKDNR